MDPLGSVLSLSQSTQRLPKERPPRLEKDIDSGWAWVVLSAAFVGVLIVNGLCYTTGIYTVELLEEFGESREKTAWVGSLQSAMSNLGGMVAGPIINRVGGRLTLVIGGLICAVGYILSSFAVSLEYLIATMGLTGIGHGLSYCAALVMTGFYFDKKRNLANGIAHTGGGIGIFVLSPIVQTLIESYGWRGSLLIIAGIVLNLLTAASVMRPIHGDALLKEVQAEIEDKTECSMDKVDREEKGTSVWANIQVFGYSKLHCVGISMACLAMAASTVFIHVPDYLKSRGFSHHQIAVMFSFLGWSNACGKLLFGLACNSDDIDNFIVYGGTVSVVAILIFLLPIFSTTYSGQLAFGVLFGLYYAGSNIMVSAIPPMLVPLKYLAMGVAILMSYIGIGFLIGPVMAGAIFDNTFSYANSFYFAGSLAFFSVFVFSLIKLCDKTEVNVTGDHSNPNGSVFS